MFAEQIESWFRAAAFVRIVWFKIYIVLSAKFCSEIIPLKKTYLKNQCEWREPPHTVQMQYKSKTFSRFLHMAIFPLTSDNAHSIFDN